LQAQSPAEHVKVGSVSSETLVVIEATEKKIQRIKDDIKEHIANGMIEGKVNKKHVAEALSDFAASVRDARKGQKNTSQSIENRSESVREHFKKSRSGGGAETHKSSNSIVYAHPKVQKHDRLDALLESEAKQPPRLPPRGSKPSIDV